MFTLVSIFIYSIHLELHRTYLRYSYQLRLSEPFRGTFSDSYFICNMSKLYSRLLDDTSRGNHIGSSDLPCAFLINQYRTVQPIYSKATFPLSIYPRYFVQPPSLISRQGTLSRSFTVHEVAYPSALPSIRNCHRPAMSLLEKYQGRAATPRYLFSRDTQSVASGDILSNL